MFNHFSYFLSLPLSVCGRTRHEWGKSKKNPKKTAQLVKWIGREAEINSARRRSCRKRLGPCAPNPGAMPCGTVVIILSAILELFCPYVSGGNNNCSSATVVTSDTRPCHYCYYLFFTHTFAITTTAISVLGPAYTTTASTRLDYYNLLQLLLPLVQLLLLLVLLILY